MLACCVFSFTMEGFANASMAAETAERFPILYHEAAALIIRSSLSGLLFPKKGKTV